jgi:hypothetical protein
VTQGVTVAVGRQVLTVEMAGSADSDAEELVHLTSRLRRELLGADVDAVYYASDEHAPDSSKGIDLPTAAGLVVHFMLRPDVLQSIIDSVWSWLGRQHLRGIKLTIDGDSLELTRASRAEQERIVELWVKRHDGGTA